MSGSKDIVIERLEAEVQELREDRNFYRDYVKLQDHWLDSDARAARWLLLYGFVVGLVLGHLR